MHLIETNLAKNPEAYKEIISLIETSFAYQAPNKFEIDFYSLIFPENFANCHFIFDQEANKPVCHIGFTKKIIKKNNITTLAYFIGGIAVAEEYRGKGIFGTFFKKLIAKYENDCAFFLLWSEKNEMYEKYKFHEFGSVIQTGHSPISYYQSNRFTKTKFNKLNKDQIKQIKNIYESKFNNYITVKRENKDWNNVVNISSADLYIETHNNSITDYFVVGKGQDLIDIIHECSFINDEDKIQELLPYKLWLSEKHVSYIKEFTPLYLSLIKINNNSHFFNFVHAIFGNDLIISEIKSSGEIMFTFKNKEHILSEEDFIHALWGPNISTDLKSYGTYFYIPGLDSI